MPFIYHLFYNPQKVVLFLTKILHYFILYIYIYNLNCFGRYNQFIIFKCGFVHHLLLMELFMIGIHILVTGNNPQMHTFVSFLCMHAYICVVLNKGN